jgi:23S rRNA (uracil1939-C5)-methyltransferase
MRAGDRVEVTIEELDDDGLGRARLAGGRELVVEDALPGESGEVVILHVGHRVHGRMLMRKLVREGQVSADRGAPACPRWTPASPCRVMHLHEDAQAAFKQARVTRALAAAGCDATVVRPILRSPRALGWRAKAAYVVARNKEGALVFGAYRRGTHIVQNMVGCPLEEAPLGEAARALLAAAAQMPLQVADPDLVVARDDGCGGPRAFDPARLSPKPQPRNPRLAPDGLRYVVLRASAKGEVVGALLTPSGKLAAAEALADAVPEVSLWLGRSGAGDALFGPGPLAPLAGAQPLEERFAELDFEVSPGAFFQINRGAAERLHALAAAFASGEVIVDAYAGVGALALRLARSRGRVIAIEAMPDAAEDARRSAVRNGLADRLEVLCADAAAGLESLAGRVRPDAIVLNPPRKGCDARALAAAAALAPGRLVYVSCNPATLARDAALLATHGYTLTDATPVDLFPHSEHVECVALFSPALR